MALEFGNCSPGRGREASGACPVYCPAAGGEERAAGEKDKTHRSHQSSPGKRAGQADLRLAGAVPAVERGIPYGRAAHPSPAPPKACLCSSGSGDPCSSDPSLLALLLLQPCRAVPLGEFLFFRDFEIWLFQRLSRGRSGHICRELSTQRCVCPVLNPSGSLHILPEQPWDAGEAPAGSQGWNCAPDPHLGSEAFPEHF